MLKKQILTLFGEHIRNVLEDSEEDFEQVQEIRMRVGKPILMKKNQGEYFLTKEGLAAAGNQEKMEQFQPIVADERDVSAVVEHACGHSSYAFESEIQKGYITIPGGHRIGICGRTVLESGKIKTIKHISALNLRIAHPVTGCAGQWAPYFYQDQKPVQILIISPPGCGKTTLLRDLILLFSNGCRFGPGVTVAVADERSEIGGTYRGVAAYDLGLRTDVLDGCPKKMGMEILLRAMAPQVMAVDEIGQEDVSAMNHAVRCGCKIIATLHGEGLSDFMDKPGLKELRDAKVFDRYVVLHKKGKPGRVKEIYDGDYQVLWEDTVC